MALGFSTREALRNITLTRENMRNYIDHHFWKHIIGISPKLGIVTSPLANQ